MSKIFIIFLASIWACKSDDYQNITPNHDDDAIFLINGGYIPEEHKYAKHIVSLADTFRFDPNSEDTFGQGHFCGGIIIGLKTILTAAHCCFDAENLDEIVVVAGTPIRTQISETTQILSIVKIIIHPGYDDTEDSQDDIALVHLKDVIVEDHEAVERISLPHSATLNPGTNCTAVGWGRMGETGHFTEELKYMNITVFENERCEEYISLIANTFCAGDESGEIQNACDGDSGGPIFCEEHLAGITVYGTNCSIEGPTFFTHIYKYLDWINENSVRPHVKETSAQCKLFVSIPFDIFGILLFVFIS